MNQTSEQSRILAVSLSSRGFGYAVMEGNCRLIDYGKKIINKKKNARSLAHIDKLIARSEPTVLALQNVNTKGSRRVPRIKKLHLNVVALAKRHKIKTGKISGTELRTALLGDPKGTRHGMAVVLAQKFPDELASRLPSKRKLYDSEDARMDIFMAVGLAVFRKANGNAKLNLKNASLLNIQKID
jgi:hypothetical protein